MVLVCRVLVQHEMSFCAGGASRFSAGGRIGLYALCALPCMFVRVRRTHWAWEARAHGPEHTCGAHPEHIRSTVEHHSENLVVSVFLLYLVIVSDCSFQIWLDETRGEGRESFGDNFWAASKKWCVNSVESSRPFFLLGTYV